MQETRQGSVTLVLGGARSGKSRYAQQLAEQSRHVVFVATAKASDEEMRAEGEDSAAIGGRVEALCEALRTAQCTVVLVSNEVGSGVVPPYPVGCRFRDLLGEINQKVARVADDVVLMVAGLPLALKGHVEVTL